MAKFTVADMDSSARQLPHLNPLVATLLINRGISDVNLANEFLSPHYENHSHDPFLMKDMEKAVKRTLEAIKNNEHIVIFSDYDADGIPGGVILHDAFKKIGFNNFSNYIPHRHDEGFGLNIEAIKEFQKKDAKLIITIDCGINDAEEVAYANKLQINVIITDHHMPPKILPRAFAIINPKQAGCSYPEKMLCGAGVIYKFVLALLKRGVEQKIFEVKQGWEKWLLDMVGIATLSDMVPLVGENRMFAHYGLKVLRMSQRLGLQKLLNSLNISQNTLSEEDVGFSITPRINVASRMSSPIHAFELLSTDDHVKADALIIDLDKKNGERKILVAGIVKEIKKKMREHESLGDPDILVFGDIKWKPAVLGLVANSIMKETSKPVFVWGRGEGEIIKGSCRSNGSVSLIDLMAKLPEGLIKDFGGHTLSGGFSVEKDRLHDLAQELNNAVKLIPNEKIDLSIIVDSRLSLNQINSKTWKLISSCAPFGEGNAKPMFLIERAFVRKIKLFGKNKEHIEFKLTDENGEDAIAIQFFASEREEFSRIKEGDYITMLCHLEESLFKGYPEYRLRISEII